jgi:hypothetical protein
MRWRTCSQPERLPRKNRDAARLLPDAPDALTGRGKGAFTHIADTAIEPLTPQT